MRHLTRPLTKILLGLAAVSSAGLTSAALAKGSEPVTSDSIGEISFALGKATITQLNGNKLPVAMGMQIHVGDVIETGIGGQVNVRFVDNELVAVRPASTLEVVRYDYNSQHPQDSVIKFKLGDGTVRAISGEGATKSRQNFRMNTPLAAIGVRGTDFVVSIDGRSGFAMVNEGAIVVAPFSSQCSADALGPCAGQEVSSLSRQILQLNSTATGVAFTLLPTTNAQALVVEASAKADGTAKPAKPAEAKELYTETVTSRAVNTTLASNTKTSEVALPPAPLPEFTPVIAQSVEALTTNAQLVWGRYSNANLANERITTLYGVGDSAIKENNLNITVGTYAYGLFRAGPEDQMQPGLRELSFNLNKAQVVYSSGGQSDLMQVSGGQLSLDFNAAKFSTSLQLNHAKTGAITFADQGTISSGGYFTSRSDSQSMAGAVSLDGKEAGYLFQKILSGGTIDGLTLWGKKP